MPHEDMIGPNGEFSRQPNVIEVINVIGFVDVTGWEAGRCDVKRCRERGHHTCTVCATAAAV